MSADLPPEEQFVRELTLQKLQADPERYLADYTREFGNILNADNAATLFDEYNADRARYREAVHEAATWIRDELFRRALAERAPEGRNRVFFMAGGVRELLRCFSANPAIEFVFMDNSAAGIRQGSVELVAPRDYTRIRERLYELLKREYASGRISYEIFQHTRGRVRS